MLEFQARQVRAAARLATFDPGDSAWPEYALHGARYLRETLWDKAHGGWFWLTTASGEPKAAATKHAHGTSYAVQALAWVHRVTSDPLALELAEEGFAWFDRHAHDAEHGGYHGWLLRDGTPIRGPANVPRGAGTRDPMGHASGLKDINVGGDWFEALLDLRGVLPNAPVAARLAELAGLYLSHWTTPEGHVENVFQPDWRLVPGAEHHGYGFQAAHRLLRAGRELENEALTARARSVLTHSVARARHAQGGFYTTSCATSAAHGSERALSRKRTWWVQLEALRACAVHLAQGNASPRYWDELSRQWAFFRRAFLDARYGGVYATCPDDVGLLGHCLPHGPRDLRKGTRWKDASHDADCLLACIEALSVRVEAPLAVGTMALAL